MRRLAYSVVAACGLLMLAACGGSGTGFAGTPGNTTTNPDIIIFQNGSAQADDFFVSASGNAPVLVSAIGQKGTGAFATVIPDLNFVWSATYLPAGTTFVAGPTPNGNTACGTPPVAATFPINSLLQQGGAGAAYPAYAPFYSQLGVQPGTTPPNYTQLTSQIFVGAPFNAATGARVAPTGANYCIQLVATYPPTGRVGTVTVVVMP